MMKAADLAVDVEIWQLAEQQCNDLDTLAADLLLADDNELARGITEAAASVLQCITEGARHPGATQFQKNFLVIAKSFNAACGVHLEQCARKKNSDPENVGLLQARNKALETLIASAIRNLQHIGLQRNKEILSNNVLKHPLTIS